MMYITEVVDTNYLASPVEDRAGRPYGRHAVFIRLPWLATSTNPDPISPHPVPTFLNHLHRDRQDWVPIAPGTRVVVAQVNASRTNPLGLAVVAYGPQNTDDVYGDLRETAEYHSWPASGGIDLWVDKQEDPVFGPNEDVGRTHLDGRGYGWQTRHPWPGDPNRDEKITTAPGTVVTDIKRLDNAVVKHEVVHTGVGVVYTIALDGLAKTMTLMDDKGNSWVVDSTGMTQVLTAITSIQLSAPNLGFFGEAAIPKPTVTGSKEDVPALASLCSALAALGLITDSTT